MNYYPHHIGDYAKDTGHLSMIEHGAYRGMMDVYYSRERPLPLDRDALYRLVRARSAAERKAVDTVLSEFFNQQDDGWHHKRCDEEIVRAQEKSSKAARSANVRWQCERITPIAMQTHSEGNAPNSQEPITKSTPRKRGSRKTPIPDPFTASTRVLSWAKKQGFRNLDQHLESFVSKCKAKDYRYVDWDEALMGAMRDDWAKLGRGSTEEIV